MREILLVMEERRAGEMLAMLENLGVLRAIHPYLAWPYSAGSPIGVAEDVDLSDHERRDVYLAILASEFAGDPADAKQLAKELGFGAHLHRLMHDAAQLARIWPQLGQEDLSLSQIYHLLHGLDLPALRAFANISAMSADHVAWNRLHNYLNTLHNVRTEIDGDYLRELGLPPGPLYGRLLGELLNAKLDRNLPDREAEERFVGDWLARGGLLGEE